MYRQPLYMVYCRSKPLWLAALQWPSVVVQWPSHDRISECLRGVLVKQVQKLRYIKINMVDTIVGLFLMQLLHTLTSVQCQWYLRKERLYGLMACYSNWKCPISVVTLLIYDDFGIISLIFQSDFMHSFFTRELYHFNISVSHSSHWSE